MHLTCNFKKTIVLTFVIVIYSLFFYFLLMQQLNTDFSAFYGATLHYIHGENPFEALDSSFLNKDVTLPLNLNPPLFLQLFIPLIHLSYQTSWLLWSIASLFCGIVGALICFYLATDRFYFRKNYVWFSAMYLLMYSSLMNTSMSQVGGFLLLFIMLGYLLYLHQHDYWSGCIWGLAIAIKFFPGLLFFFVLYEKRYRTFSIMLGTTILLSLWPLYTKGMYIYTEYIQALKNVVWYGASWNASLYGFMARLLHTHKPETHTLFIQISYMIFFLSTLLWYLNNLRQQLTQHQAFCLTLVLMLLLSPFGWIYYFSLLLMPLMLLAYTLNQLEAKSSKTMCLWTLSIFFINTPHGNALYNTETFFYKASLYSVYFYGLILISYLLSHLEKPDLNQSVQKQAINSAYIMPVLISLSIGAMIVLGNLLKHYVRIWGG